MARRTICHGRTRKKHEKKSQSSVLLAGGKLVLPFQLQFEFDLVQLFLKTLIFLNEVGIPLPLRIDGAMQLPKIQLVVIRSEDERTDRRAAHMGTMADIRATLFEFGLEQKWHWHPFRVGNDTDLPKNRFPHNISPLRGGLNCYFLISKR